MRFFHEWFPDEGVITYYEFFNKFNVESEKKEQLNNLKKFFMGYKPPLIPNNELNKASLH